MSMLGFASSGTNVTTDLHLEMGLAAVFGVGTDLIALLLVACDVCLCSMATVLLCGVSVRNLACVLVQLFMV